MPTESQPESADQPSHVINLLLTPQELADLDNRVEEFNQHLPEGVEPYTRGDIIRQIINRTLPEIE